MTAISVIADITSFKRAWAATACACVMVHLATSMSAAVDWRYVLKNNTDRKVDKELLIRAWTSLRGECCMLLLQILLSIIRVGWMFGPSPANPKFAALWERDATTITVGQAILAAHCLLSLWDRRRTISLLRHRKANMQNLKSIRAILKESDPETARRPENHQ